MAARQGNFVFNAQKDGDYFETTQFNFKLGSLGFDGKIVKGDPIDMTAAIAKIQFRRGGFQGKLVREFDSSGTVLIWNNAVLGQLQLSSFLIDWGPGTYYFDLQITTGIGVITTYVQGTVVILAQSTR
jgi:hypothetical protein